MSLVTASKYARLLIHLTWAAVLADPCSTINCTGLRYDMAINPYGVSCRSHECSVEDCCTTPRPTCADPEVFDCSLAIKHINPNPNDIFCLKAGCSIAECCTEENAASPSPSEPGSTNAFDVVAVVAAAAIVAFAFGLGKLCSKKKVAVAADSRSIYEAKDATDSPISTL